MEKTKGRNSARREIIYDIVASTKSHPTAEWVYERARCVCDGIGIATVYRNLRGLAECGRLDTVETTDGITHYDADLSTHAHFVCRECGRISDFEFLSDECERNLIANGYEIERKKLVLYGVCSDCKKG